MLTCIAHASRFVHSHDTPVAAIIVALVVAFALARLAFGGRR